MTDVPQPAMSGYLHFIQKNRDRVQGEGFKSTEIIQKLAVEWKSLDDKEKKKWDDIAKEDKIRFNTQKELWLKDHPGQDFPKKEKDKKKKKENNDMKAVEVLEVKDPDPEVQAYPKIEDDGKKSKKKKLKQPVVPDPNVLDVEVEPESTKKEKGKNKFLNFCRAKREEIWSKDRKKKVTEVTSILAGIWKTLSDEEKQEYA